jgi:RHS repeat-associated protein
VLENSYDVDGALVATRVLSATGQQVRATRYLVDPSGPLSHVIAETDEGGNLQALYLRGEDELLAILRPSGTRFVHTDGLGSTRLLTNEAGQPTDRYTFNALGELLAHSGQDANPYLFAGEPREPLSGFSYHRTRWLDASTGRFLSMDAHPGSPLDPPSLHRYLYAHADPVNKRDPTGRFTLSEISISTANQARAAYLNLRAAFLVGGSAVGRMWNVFGDIAERAARQVLTLWNPSVQPEIALIANRRLDNLIIFANRVMFLEVKYSLPRKMGDALVRLVGQVAAANATGRGQVVIWSYSEPTQATLRFVLRHLGPLAPKVQFVHGVEGLYAYLKLYFGG